MKFNKHYNMSIVTILVKKNIISSIIMNFIIIGNLAVKLNISALNNYANVFIITFFKFLSTIID